MGVSQQQTGLRGDDGQHFQVGAAKQPLYITRTDIERTEELAALTQGHTHDARQSQIHHRLRVLKLGVLAGIADDHRLLGPQHLGDNRVGQLGVWFADRLLAFGPSELDAGRHSRGRQHQKAIVGLGDLDHGIDQRGPQLLGLIVVEQPLREAMELAHGTKHVGIGAYGDGRRRCRLLGRKLDKTLTELDALALGQLELALALAQHEHIAIDRHDGHVLLAARKVSVAGLDLRVADHDVVVGTATEGG